MGMTMQTRVTLCGTLAAEIAGRPVHPALPGRKGRLLFARLTIGRDAPVGRDELIDAIWSEKPPVDPDAAFSTLLTRTRCAVGRDVIQGRGELRLVLGDDAWIDWEIARASASSAEARLDAGDQRGALDAATAGLQIVRRPLLPDMTTRWIEDCRRELVELHAALLEAAAKASLRMGGEHLAAAERHARELIGREPYRESAYALLMETHTARGNVAEALRVYDELRRLLRDELGLTPAHALTSLATRLLAEPEAHIPAGGETAPACELRTSALAPPTGLEVAARTRLVGRDSELSWLLTACSDAAEGEARVVVLAGEAGIGKTRLAAELANNAHRQGFDVLHGRAERDGVTPYQPFVEAVRQVLRERPSAARGIDPSLHPELAELARLVPELRSTVMPSDDPELCRHRIFMAVSAVLSTLLQERPLVLVLDDLQWADASTLLLLRHVVRGAHAERLLIIATLRSDEPPRADLRAVLLDLSADGSLEHVALDGLTRADAAELVADHGASDAGRLWEQTGGNPFLIMELAHEGEEHGVPAAIREAVDCRLLRLSRTGRKMVLAAARAGCSFDPATVAALSEVPQADVADALSEAVQIGLVTSTAGGLAFRHPIVHRALLALSEGAGAMVSLR
jgi:DNA-binding SARP family transcriptional activator